MTYDRNEVRREIADATGQPRPLHVIADEIVQDWKTVNYAAVPYLSALRELDSVHQQYGYDSAASVTRYFLANATSWRGPVARRIKAELKEMVKGVY